MWVQNAVRPGLFQLMAHGRGKQPECHESTATKLPQSRRKSLKSPICGLRPAAGELLERLKTVSRVQKGGEVVVGCTEVGTASVLSSHHPQFRLQEGSVVVGEWVHLRRSATCPAFTAGSVKDGLPLAEETVL